jgi:beta-lactamase regulating signal transducer with metallopeptidase domain
MTAAWMVYALLVGALVALAAHALDGVCRLAAWPSRCVWAGAMAVTIALVALAPQRESSSAPVVLPLSIEVTTSSRQAAQETMFERAAASLGRLRTQVANSIAHGFATAARLAPAPVERVLISFWAVLSVLAFLVYFIVHGRLGRAKRAWPSAELHGARVRLAPDAGPAVIGLVRPEIVVPRWLLQRTAAEQRMVIAHEAEHLRAHDPILLTAACAAVALVAWHPAMWWMLSRLRLAVELDCDHRIVRSGVAPRSYGALLIELAGRCSSGMRIGAPALSDGSSHLERRLIAMTSKRPKFARVSALALATCSIALVALACDAKLPTSEEVNSMDVAAAEGAAQRVALMSDSGLVYTIDGKKATAAEAHALTPEEIASIEVVKQKRKLDDREASARQSGEVRILTKRAADSLGVVGMRKRTFDGNGAFTIVRKGQLGGQVSGGGATPWRISADTLGIVPLQRKDFERKDFDGVLVLDGVRVNGRELSSISPDEILSVEVLKGDAARKLYSDSAAANGVIRITTRNGARLR